MNLSSIWDILVILSCFSNIQSRDILHVMELLKTIVGGSEGGGERQRGWEEGGGREEGRRIEDTDLG